MIRRRRVTSGRIVDATIVAADLASNAVETAKIKDDAVTPPKVGFNLPLYGYFHGTWAIDGDGAGTNGGGMVGTLARGEIALTTQAAAYAKVFDASEGAGTWRNLAVAAAGAGYAANFQCFPATEGVGDIVAFGAALPFCEVAFNLSATVGVWAGDSCSWEFGDPASSPTTLVLVQDQTDTNDATAGLRPLSQDGTLHFIPPATWAAATIDGQEAYWIMSVIAGAQMTTAPVLSDEHAIVTPVDGLTVPCDCYITAARAWTEAATVPTAADVKFVIMNFTTGVVSNELTWAQDKGTDSWTGITGTGTGTKLTCAAGDVIGILVTQEDGTNELTNVHMNFTLVPQ